MAPHPPPDSAFLGFYTVSRVGERVLKRDRERVSRWKRGLGGHFCSIGNVCNQIYGASRSRWVRKEANLTNRYILGCAAVMGGEEGRAQSTRCFRGDARGAEIATRMESVRSIAEHRPSSR